MDLDAALSSLKRARMGTVIVAVQVALTMAIVINAVYFSAREVQRMRHPSGVDERNIVVLYNSWFHPSSDLKARLQSDLAILRGLPEVIDASVTDGLPLTGTGFSTSVNIGPDSPQSNLVAALYPLDAHGLQTLGIQLIAGRWFTTAEILDSDENQAAPDRAPAVIITKSLADALFPAGGSLGRHIYLNENLTTIVGLVARLEDQSPWIHGVALESEMSVIAPYLWARPTSLYVIRARAGHGREVLAIAQTALRGLSHDRLLFGAEPFTEIRHRAYQPTYAVTVILSAVSALLLTITALGILGLSSYRVIQRRSQIGLRRALGARRIDIVWYFQIENLIVVGSGALIGVFLTLAVNALVMSHFATTRVPAEVILAGAIAVIGLGQSSVLWPAFQAAAVPPSVALRGR
jgi:putative ABC transport system permease protein